MYVLGIDLGTSALKGILLSKTGTVVAQARKSYTLRHVKDGYSEQNPQDWIDALTQVWRSIINQCPSCINNIDGLAISGQMHGLVTLDKVGRVVRPAILWNDTRTTKQCQNIMSNFSDDLLKQTKNKALEGFTLPKIVWMQENEPDLWETVRYIMLPKDYLIWYLTGQHASDYSDAAGTLLLNITHKTWATSILNQYHIDEKQLPKLYQSIDVVGHVKKDILAQFNMTKDVKVVAGGADNACAAIGAGIVKDNVGLLSIGTSGVFLSYEKNVTDNYKGQLHLFNHGVPNSYYAMGVTLAAGHSLNWFKQTFAPNQSFEQLLDGIEVISCGANGLLFTPYIVGERTPYADSQIRGSFIGIDTRHTIKHFTRSVLEGITFSLKDCQQLMNDVTNKTFHKVVSVGGGSKNNIWLQMQADIFNTSIVSLKHEEGPSLGAAILACVGVGWFNNVCDAVNQCVVYNDVVTPIKENVEQYRDVYNTYKKIYPSLKHII